MLSDLRHVGSEMPFDVKRSGLPVQDFSSIRGILQFVESIGPHVSGKQGSSSTCVS